LSEEEGWEASTNSTGLSEASLLLCTVRMSLSGHHNHASSAEQGRLQTAAGLGTRVMCCRPAVQQASWLSHNVLRARQCKACTGLFCERCIGSDTLQCICLSNKYLLHSIHPICHTHRQSSDCADAFCGLHRLIAALHGSSHTKLTELLGAALLLMAWHKSQCPLMGWGLSLSRICKPMLATIGLCLSQLNKNNKANRGPC